MKFEFKKSFHNATKEEIEEGKVTTEKCKCRLYIRAYVSGASGTLHGMWSPDSVGSCKVANP